MILESGFPSQYMLSMTKIELCRALQKRDEDIVHAIELIADTKYYLEALRTDAGWDDFLTKVTSFCTKHKIKVVDMEGPYFPVGQPRRGYVMV